MVLQFDPGSGSVRHGPRASAMPARNSDLRGSARRMLMLRSYISSNVNAEIIAVQNRVWNGQQEPPKHNMIRQSVGGLRVGPHDDLGDHLDLRGGGDRRAAHS